MRLRLEFQDAGLLSGSQRRQGLQKCWLQLPPGISTIADFSAYVHETFGLHHSCPRGIILTVDGFVLPLFISICILKDEDIIMIKKNGVIFEDSVIFFGSQNQENIQGRQISKLKNMNVATIGTLVASHGALGDNRCKVHIESSQSKKMDELCMSKRFSRLHCSTKTVAIKDFQGDYLEDKENTGLDGNTAVHKETSSCGIVDAKLKKKHCSKHQTSDVLLLKSSQVDSQGDKNHLDFHIPHKEISSCEKTKGNIRNDRLQGLNDTLAIKEFVGKLQKDREDVEENIGLYGTIAHDKTMPIEMMSSHCRKINCNKLQTYDCTSTSKDSQVDSQGGKCDFSLSIPHKASSSSELIQWNNKRKHFDKLQGSNDKLAVNNDSQGILRRDEEGNGLHGNAPHKKAINNKRINVEFKKTCLNESIFHKKAAKSEMMNAKRKRKCSNKIQTFTFAIWNSQGNSQRKDDLRIHKCMKARKEIPYKLKNAKFYGKHSFRLHNSGNATMGFDNEHTSKKCVIGDANKKPSRSASRKKAKRLWHRHHGSKKMEEGKETLQWNGRTEQMWSREKFFNKWNNDTSILLNNGESSGSKEAKELVEFSNEKSDVEEGEIYDESLVPNQEEPIKECGESKNFTVKEFHSAKQLIDFERFLPLVRLPEEGDVLVYRSLKTSSFSWCSELSPFQVGRVSSYDCSTAKVILLPLPEYPHTPEKEMPEEGQGSFCLYKEDGTLEVKLSSIVDVRLFKACESSDSTPTLLQ